MDLIVNYVPQMLAAIVLLCLVIVCQIACWCPIVQRFSQRWSNQSERGRKTPDTINFRIQVLPQKRKVIVMPSGSLNFGKMCASNPSNSNQTPLLDGMPIYLAGYDSDGEPDVLQSCDASSEGDGNQSKEDYQASLV
eukprot:TRINITY_DN7805_c0_g1_i1.p4 TRINITY_DN7805_c0_g1~~TRINITY_DN7805_c0_g1_i1.p4  ORF type:complete len:137 (-),score=19.23 TRINITY_DN7805_c0_g1_i1:229-639(-)